MTTSPLLKLSDKFCRYAFSQTTHFDYGGQRYVQIILPHSYMIVIAVILALIAKQRYVPIPVSMKATRIELKRNMGLCFLLPETKGTATLETMDSVHNNPSELIDKEKLSVEPSKEKEELGE